MKKKWIEFLYWMLKKEYYGKQLDKKGFILTKWYLLRKLAEIKQPEIWEYGKLEDRYKIRPARKNKKTGVVQIFKKKWIVADSVWWSQFRV